MKRMFFIPITLLFLTIIAGCAFVNSFFFPGDLKGGGSSSSAPAVINPDSYNSPNIGLLKFVPAGVFQYDNGAGDTNTLTIAFHMSQYIITRAQFSNVTGFDPSVTAQSTGTNDPVQNVNWYMAICFCNLLSMKEGLTPVYTVSNGGAAHTNPSNWPGGITNIPTGVPDSNYDKAIANWSANGYRLPTEMEWMWAAMGGASDNIISNFGPGGINTNGYSKPFAGSTGFNDISNYVWHNGNSGSTTHPVGTKLSNELGLYDISGNVWQWCWDWFDGQVGSTASWITPFGAQIDYRGVVSNSFRVCRGNGWAQTPSDSAVNFRGHNNADYRDNTGGFRVVRR